MCYLLKAWANLVAKYEPKTTASKVQLKHEFSLCIMDNVSKDPAEWDFRFGVYPTALKGDEVRDQ